MALVLQPSLDEHSREEIIAHIEQVRARRMLAALIYSQSVTERNAVSANVIERKLEMQFTGLAREIAQLDKYDAMISKRLTKIAELQHEYNLLITFGIE
jgi:hypothetical protein